MVRRDRIGGTTNQMLTEHQKAIQWLKEADVTSIPFISHDMRAADKRNLVRFTRLGAYECMDYEPVMSVRVANASGSDIDTCIDLSDDPGAPWIDWYYLTEEYDEDTLEQLVESDTPLNFTFTLPTLREVETLWKLSQRQEVVGFSGTGTIEKLSPGCVIEWPSVHGVKEHKRTLQSGWTVGVRGHKRSKTRVPKT
jgi:hypothetical protein